ncbi:MaoC family dehydratase [Nocardioides zeae]|uniref:MaoC family dehydratase n=1 Tax=Nocardioides imazamoxiresistens TaxID=3231893 RepID=A0ABU3PXZ3_9ACTN|nr:MaoC family dehydratase [Nocardioides zeae]MDT9594108.1 MaoC family dehydratase [Nocardioides zeae]
MTESTYAGPRTFADAAELRAAVGTHLGHSDWHQVTQEQVDLFAEATGDHQWIHVDPERAASGPFGGTIAHGYLTLSLVPMLSQQVYAFEGLRMGVNYGSDKVRFPAPVRVGSRIRGGVEVLSLEPGGGGERLTTRVSVEVEGGDRPACVAEVVSVLVW